jgi:hypothetical protein
VSVTRSSTPLTSIPVYTEGPADGSGWSTQPRPGWRDTRATSMLAPTKTASPHDFTKPKINSTDYSLNRVKTRETGDRNAPRIDTSENIH